MSDPRKVKLNTYHNSEYNPGAGTFKRMIWFLLNGLIIQAKWIPSSGLRVMLLKMFGAKLGEGLVLKPGINVKYPWKLTIGDHVWIGENVWLDTIDDIVIGSHCCISQGAYLCTGNHDWTDESFSLRTDKITLEDGCWVGAKSVVLPGVTIGSHAILTAGSVASSNLPAYQICRGNPAIAIKERVIRDN